MQNVSKPSRKNFAKKESKPSPSLGFSQLQSLTEVRVDAAVRGVLTRLNARIQVTVGLGESAEAIVIDYQGRSICTLNELIQLGTIRRWLSKVSKSKLLADELPRVKTVLANFNRMFEDEGKKAPRITGQLTNDMKTLMRSVDAIGANLATIEISSENAGDMMFVDLIQTYCAKMISAHTRAMIRLVEGRPLKGYLKDAYAILGVPKFFYRTFPQKNRINAGQTARKFIFPAKRMKGFFLSLKEIQNRTVVEGAQPLLVRIEKFLPVLTTDGMLNHLIAPHPLPEGGSKNEEKLLNVSLLIPPVIDAPEQFTRSRGKGGLIGFSTSPMAGDAAGMLRHNFSVLVRAIAAEAAISSAQVRFWDRAFPVLSRSFGLKEPAQQYLQVVDASLEEEGVAQAVMEFVHLSTSGAQEAFKNLLCHLGQWSETHDIVLSLYSALISDSAVQSVEVPPRRASVAGGEEVKQGEMPIPIVASDDFSITWSELFKAADLEEIADPPPKRLTRRGGRPVLAQTSMGRAAKQLMKSVQRSAFLPLADEIREWLTSFGNDQIQSEAARLMAVQLRNGFEESDRSTSESSESNESDDEFAL